MANLHRIYRDICRGYTETRWAGKPAFLKHLTSFEYAEADEYRDTHLARAKAAGIPTREEREAWLVEKELWSESDEKKLKDYKTFIDGMRTTREKLLIKAQIRQIDRQIAENEKEYQKLFERKEKLFDLTAEHVAGNKVQYFYAYLSFYRDAELNERLFTLDDLNNWDEEESLEVLLHYMEHVNEFAIENIQKLSISPLFLIHFNLCGEDLTRFYLKPLWELTLHQANLLSSGQYFQTITRGENIPKEIADDPKKIEDFVKKSAAAKEVLRKATEKEGDVGIFGARDEDFKDMNLKEDRSFIEEGMESMLVKLKA